MTINQTTSEFVSSPVPVKLPEIRKSFSSLTQYVLELKRTPGTPLDVFSKIKKDFKNELSTKREVIKALFEASLPHKVGKVLIDPLNTLKNKLKEIPGTIKEKILEGMGYVFDTLILKPFIQKHLVDPYLNN